MDGERIAEAAQMFTDSFVNAFNDAISTGLVGIDLSEIVSSAIIGQDIYSIGYEKGSIAKLRVLPYFYSMIYFAAI